MVWRTHDHGVELFALVVKLAHIEILSRFGIFLGCGFQISLVDIAKRDDVFATNFLEVFSAPSAYADDRQIEFFIRPNTARATLSWGFEGKHKGACCGGCAKELAASNQAMSEMHTAHPHFVRSAGDGTSSFWESSRPFQPCC